MTLGITRSLADFAKLVELFDAHGVSFNWVAQAFNTTTSMGRLTLNVLLSFAQFEREITGERIRDKAAASKRKGIWMGGAVPLGYRVQDRPLQPVEGEAEFVRALFRRYLEIGRVVKLKTALDSENVHSPTRMSRRAKGQAPHRSREAISNGSCRTRFMSDGYATKGGFTTGFIRRSRTLRPGTGSSTSSRAKRRQGEHPVQMISPSARASSMTIAETGWARAMRPRAGGAGETTCRAALSGRKQDSGPVVRVPASEIEIRVANAVGARAARATTARQGRSRETDAQAPQETRLRARSAGERQTAFLRRGHVGDGIVGSL
jgi:hypothetical protein